jgi:hydroxyacylglutathione hydrolase
MLFRLIYDDRLAQAAYLIGCQRTREAIIFDPERDIDRYLALASQHGLHITGIAETHIHADFLSGARQLAEATGAHLYLSGEGGPDWSYTWLDKKRAGGTYPHTLLHHNDTFSVGNIEFTAVHTPGHTPEHVSFLVTDRGSGADDPMGVISGDFVFVGDLGRPDLLETAAGIQGVKESSARDLQKSAAEFLNLPDHLQIWPAHGAGSACGKALGAVPQSTVGYEKRHNPSLRLATDPDAFVRYILEGQPDPPLYFARMKRQNRDGPAILDSLPTPTTIDAQRLAALDPKCVAIIDTRNIAAFSEGHLRGSLFAPLNNTLLNVIGSYVEPENDICIIAQGAMVDELVRACVRIGLDRVLYHATPSTLADALQIAGADSLTHIDAHEAINRRERADFILDVRSAAEFDVAHVPGALNIPYTRLAARIQDLPTDRPIVVHCAVGGRSAPATAYLKARGFEASNVAGGFIAWQRASGPVETVASTANA